MEACTAHAASHLSSQRVPPPGHLGGKRGGAGRWGRYLSQEWWAGPWGAGTPSGSWCCCCHHCWSRHPYRSAAGRNPGLGWRWTWQWTAALGGQRGVTVVPQPGRRLKTKDPHPSGSLHPHSRLEAWISREQKHPDGDLWGEAESATPRPLTWPRRLASPQPPCSGFRWGSESDPTSAPCWPRRRCQTSLGPFPHTDRAHPDACPTGLWRGCSSK